MPASQSANVLRTITQGYHFRLVAPGLKIKDQSTSILLGRAKVAVSGLSSSSPSHRFALAG